MQCFTSAGTEPYNRIDSLLLVTKEYRLQSGSIGSEIRWIGMLEVSNNHNLI